jgi:pyruvate dehydrogenase E2 component (dihydrolipoamide acetyltransferase)
MDLKLPPLGEGVDSGSVVSILVKEGETVQKGQGVIELETGKAVAPVPASSAGKVTKIIVSVGDKISVGQPILSIEGGAAPAAAPAKAAAPKAAAPAPRAAKPAAASAAEEAPEEEAPEPEAEDTTGPEPATSPTIRRLSRELGINLRKIRGSENGGRIIMADVRGYIERLQRLAAQPRTDGPAGTAAKATAELPDFTKWGQIAKKPMTQLRKVIAQRMGESWASVPRVTQFDDADVTAINALGAAAKPDKLTVTAFAIKIIADTLKKHPAFNTTIDLASGEIIFKEYVNLGIAVDTEQGLIVPVLRDADKKDVRTIAKELKEIATKTRERKISMEDLQGGTFTISNQGGIGSKHFTPIVNLPETAILGLGRSSLQAQVREGKIEPRLMLPLALSYDHRVIDGGSAARFMVDIVRGFETFDAKQLG